MRRVSVDGFRRGSHASSSFRRRHRHRDRVRLDCTRIRTRRSLRIYFFASSRGKATKTPEKRTESTNRQTERRREKTLRKERRHEREEHEERKNSPIRVTPKCKRVKKKVVTAHHDKIVVRSRVVLFHQSSESFLSPLFFFFRGADD